MASVEPTAVVSASQDSKPSSTEALQQAATHTLPVDVTASSALSEEQSALSKKVASMALGEWFTEKIHGNWGQTFHVSKWILVKKSPQQEIVIFENEIFGRVLALDGAIQITEKDEYVYQEMMAHVPLIAHGNAKNVLIVGGGDGGILREVLRHTSVERAFLVEIDGDVVAFSKEHLSHISRGSFDDPRVSVVIEDGCKFVKEAPVKFDVIICDSTDPVGPGQVLFTSEFYGDCHKLLNKGGIFVNQNGVPFLQPEELDTVHRRKEHFQDVGFYVASIPTYAGGHMTLGWATDDGRLRDLPEEEIERRLKNVKNSQDLQYYNAAIHRGCFALPNFIRKKLLKT